MKPVASGADASHYLHVRSVRFSQLSIHIHLSTPTLFVRL